MIEIYIKDQLAVVCLPELAAIIIQMLVPQLGPEYKIETKVQKKDAE